MPESFWRPSVVELCLAVARERDGRIEPVLACPYSDVDSLLPNGSEDYWPEADAKGLVRYDLTRLDTVPDGPPGGLTDVIDKTRKRLDEHSRWLENGEDMPLNVRSTLEAPKKKIQPTTGKASLSQVLHFGC